MASIMAAGRPSTVLAAAPLILAAAAIAVGYGQMALDLGLSPQEFSRPGDATVRAAPYAFAIWGLIYAGLVAMGVFEVLPAGRRSDVAGAFRVLPAREARGGGPLGELGSCGRRVVGGEAPSRNGVPRWRWQQRASGGVDWLLQAR